MNASWLNRRFARFVPDAIHRAWSDVLAAFANDWNIAQLARALASDLSIALNDALRIAATEAMDEYRAATLEVYRGSDIVVGWEWVAQDDACDECRDLNGTKHDLSEDQEAPHPRCRCRQKPILASEQAA